MGFSRSDIARSMDVYTRDDVYLGSVLAVAAGPHQGPSERVTDDARQSSTSSGELLGPMPTQTIGNTGPTRQAARAQYGTEPGATESLGRGSIEVGRWWGLIGRRTISLDAIQTVSMERVILKLDHDELTHSSGRPV